MVTGGENLLSAAARRLLELIRKEDKAEGDTNDSYDYF